MTALATAPTLFDDRGGEPTLDETLAGVWEGLMAHRSVECLLCGEAMVPEYGAHTRPVSGRCTGCGSVVQ